MGRFHVTLAIEGGAVLHPPPPVPLDALPAGKLPALPRLRSKAALKHLSVDAIQELVAELETVRDWMDARADSIASSRAYWSHLDKIAARLDGLEEELESRRRTLDGRPEAPDEEAAEDVWMGAGEEGDGGGATDGVTGGGGGAAELFVTFRRKIEELEVRMEVADDDFEETTRALEEAGAFTTGLLLPLESARPPRRLHP